MCCFTLPVRHVSKTRIFARALAGSRQFLAYSMNVGFDGEVAMVLPLPIAHAPGTSRAADNALRFVDMSAAPKFFDDLDALFPLIHVQKRGPAPAPTARLNLVVHDVGDFEASFVPSIDDFDRLDPRFRLPATVWSSLLAYRDHAFAVFKLKRPRSHIDATPVSVHPMAFEFERRDENALFFPTLHIHDRQVLQKANFDHTLFAQIDPTWDALCDWRRSEASARSAPKNAHAFVDVTRPVYRHELRGVLPNRDTTLDVRELASRTFLADSFRLRFAPAWMDPRLRTISRIVDGPRLPPAVEESERTRRLNSIAEAIERMCTEHAAEWPLIRFSPELPVDHPIHHYARPTPDYPSGCLVDVFRPDRHGGVFGLTLAFASLPSLAIESVASEVFQQAIDAAVTS